MKKALTLFTCISSFITLTLLSGIAKATVILQYHHISESTPAATSLSPDLFRRHMEHLQKSGYTVMALPEVVDRMRNDKSLPSKSVVITFDDGYDSVFTEAFPILKAKGWPFTVFVNTRPLETGVRGFTTWEQLNEMAEHGATIANHSHTHTHFLRREDKESESQWRARIRDDITAAEDLIKKRTGQSHRLLAYPYGEYDETVKKIARDLDFTAFGQQSGPLMQPAYSAIDWLAMPRFPFGGIYGDEEDFAVKVATLPMPLKSVSVLAGEGGKALTDILLPPKVEQPLLILTLENALPGSVQCFASGQGAIKVEVNANQIRAQADKPLPVGRSRYNCTAASNEAGRFYWHSEFFIRKRPGGEWYAEP